MFLDPKLSELELVDRIVLSDHTFRVFESFMVPFYLHAEDPFSHAHIYTSVPAKALGIHTRRPGDIDVMMLPFQNDAAQAHNLVCAEVKIIRPTQQNQGKDHKDSGREQVLGLANHGIPVVSLNHVILPFTNSADYTPLPDLNGTDLLQYFIDQTSGIGNERQSGRMNQIDLPDFTGYAANAVEEIGHFTMATLNAGKFCKRNEKYNRNLDNFIGEFLASNTQAIRILPWRD